MSALKSYPAWHVPSGLVTVLLLAIAGGAPVVAQTAPAKDTAADIARLVTVYPTFLDRVEGNVLIWKDGTRMRIDDGLGAKDHETLLATADIKDMFLAAYPLGRTSGPPGRNADPGRARNVAFFNKMYGDCQAGGVASNLVDVVWLPRKWGKSVKATRINGVASKLAAVSAELDALPSTFDQFLFPSAGTYVCRPIAGTTRVQCARPWHCHRHRHQARTLLALVRGQGRRRDSLSQLNTVRDRRDIRAARLHLGRQVVSLRYHALRVPPRTHRQPAPILIRGPKARPMTGLPRPRNGGAANTVDGSSLGTNRPISAPQYWRLLSGALLP